MRVPSRDRPERPAHRLHERLASAGLGLAHQISALKGEGNAYLQDPNYATLRLRLENAHAAVEAAAVEVRRRVRLNEGR